MRKYQHTIHFQDTNVVVRLGTWVGNNTVLVLRMQTLAKELQNAGWNITQDLSDTRTGYPQITLEANTGQEVILQVSDVTE